MKTILRSALCTIVWAAAFLLLSAAIGSANEKRLTVEQVIQVLNGLQQLDGPPAADAKPAQFYKLSGTTRMAIAVNIERARAEFKIFQTATNGLIAELSNGGATVPEERRAEFAAESSKLLAAPASVDLLRIKAADLDLDKNQIPPSTLSLLLPILDR